MDNVKVTELARHGNYGSQLQRSTQVPYSRLFSSRKFSRLSLNSRICELNFEDLLNYHNNDSMHVVLL